MDPLLLFQTFAKSATAQVDEKSTSPKATTIASPLIQTPAISMGSQILLSNCMTQSIQGQNQANLLQQYQQYLYANYLQQLAQQQQQQQLRQANAAMMATGFSPLQASTIPQSVLAADMNRKRKAMEEQAATPPKQPNLLPYYAQLGMNLPSVVPAQLPKPEPTLLPSSIPKPVATPLPMNFKSEPTQSALTSIKNEPSSHVLTQNLEPGGLMQLHSAALGQRIPTTPPSVGSAFKPIKQEASSPTLKPDYLTQMPALAQAFTQPFPASTPSSIVPKSEPSTANYTHEQMLIFQQLLAQCRPQQMGAHAQNGSLPSAIAVHTQVEKPTLVQAQQLAQSQAGPIPSALNLRQLMPAQTESSIAVSTSIPATFASTNVMIQNFAPALSLASMNKTSHDTPVSTLTSSNIVSNLATTLAPIMPNDSSSTNSSALSSFVVKPVLSEKSQSNTPVPYQHDANMTKCESQGHQQSPQQDRSRSSSATSPTETTTTRSPSLISLLTAPLTRNNSDEKVEEKPKEDNKAETREDEEEDLDIVDVVGGVPGDKGTSAVRSVQRRAHIEFYRKLKSFRNREKTLKCHLCHELVENSDNGLRSHIHLHSSAPLFVCKICQVGFKERPRIFEHLKDKHPGKTSECIEDHRDMVHLGEVLFNCFPKNNPKAKVSYQDLLKRISQYVIKEKLSNLECQICKSKVSTQRNSIIQHLHTHPAYRCKCCKHTCQDESEQVQHCRKEHNSTEPKQGVEYNICGAQEVLAATFEQCFSTYLANASSSESASIDHEA